MTGPPNVMLGMSLPDVAQWSERVTVALGQNPGPFTGPGTNTYLVGTGPRRILVDTGQGLPEYLPVLERAVTEAGCVGIEGIVLTHGHPDHTGGVGQVIERFGEMTVRKFPGPWDAALGVEVDAISDGATLRTEGATLRALHTPGHAVDHLCFVLEEDDALISGDNVLGVGTTVIPAEGGDLVDYMDSLQRALEENPNRIYPAHGPCIDDGTGKLREYIAHREEREAQILAALAGPSEGRAVAEIVETVYAAYPKALHAAAAQSVTAHLIKLEREGAVQRSDGARPLEALWRRT